METVDTRTFKEKVHEAKVKTVTAVQDGCKKVKRVIEDHPAEAFTLACVVIPGVLKCANSAIRLHQQSRETRYNECDVYDPRTGMHFYTKRPLTNNQKLNLENAYRSGRNKGDILREMNLL